jgi:lysophospholipase L1-like esterase
MRRTFVWLIPFLVMVTIPCVAAVPTFNLSDGDRVVFLGATLVERDQQYGYLETMLHARFPKAAFTFRNLGWSGDSVWGEARAEFGSQKDGYAKLVQEVSEAKPTVLLICYGQSEAFAGEAGLGKFDQQYETLLGDLARTGAKIWLIGPTWHEDLPRPLPDPAEHNRRIKIYSDAVRELAARRGCGFVDSLAALPDGAKADSPQPLTDNGLHLTAYGAWRFAQAMLAGLIPDAAANVSPATGDAAERLERIRQKTITKNRQFFHRWRPQNDTYIFGFRKHEQGKNAVEIPQFDPIVQRMEREIAEMARGLESNQSLIPAAPLK